MSGQNLFANSSFEDINICTEYNAGCAPEAWFNIPVSNFVIKTLNVPRPVFGKQTLPVPVENILDPAKRSYVYTMFCCPLKKDNRYRISFFLNTSHNEFYHLDFYFSENEPNNTAFDATEIEATAIITKKDIVADYRSGWKIVEYEFTAKGNERFCTIGNFSNEAMEYEPSQKMDSLGNIFYYLDEIKMINEDNNTVCENYKANIKMMYEQNRRHTNFVKIDTSTITKQVLLKKDTISLPAVLFEVNSAAINNGFQNRLDSLIQVILKADVVNIEIDGHTDNSGTKEKNEALSLLRANSIKDYLVKQLPQMQNVIIASGKGQSFPMADNATKEGREKNRRVEIIITYNTTIIH